MPSSRAPVYLDYHAASPLCERAREAMNEALESSWANPSSVHAHGRKARSLVEWARNQLARALSASPADVVWTSGGTEACNTMVLGAAERLEKARASTRRLVTTEIEHPAVGSAVDSLASAGWSVTRLSCREGHPPALGVVEDALANADLAVFQHVNHETGTLLPIARYSELCRERGVPLVVDATQSFGKVEVSVETLGADAIALASHKIGGPSGAGALWVRRGFELDSRIIGGGQERGRRAGSPDVLSIVGFGAAAQTIGERLSAMASVGARRDRLASVLVECRLTPNAYDAPQVATVVHASARGWRGSALVAALDLEGLSASSGAACSSGLDQPSPVISAMYPDEPWRAAGALRLSLGVETTDSEIERASEVLRRVLARKGA